jgi:hypothetical protein
MPFKNQVLLDEAAAQGRQNAEREDSASGPSEEVDVESGQSGVAARSSGEVSAEARASTTLDETTPIVTGDLCRASDDATSTTPPAHATGFQEDDPDDPDDPDGDDSQDGKVLKM